MVIVMLVMMRMMMLRVAKMMRMRTRMWMLIAMMTMMMMMSACVLQCFGCRTVPCMNFTPKPRLHGVEEAFFSIRPYTLPLNP